jgi:protein-tyrosine phosphatase
MRPRVGARLRQLRHAPARLLHPLRRRAARETVGRLPVASVLFLCHGNVCRSPFAAAVFARLLPASLAGAVRVSSAGFIGPGRQPPSMALSAAQRYGIDLSVHRSALVLPDDVRESDLVLVMSAEQATAIRRRFAEATPRLVVLGDLDPLPIRERTVRDPWDGDEGVFAESYARLERCTRELVYLVVETHAH